MPGWSDRKGKITIPALSTRRNLPLILGPDLFFSSERLDAHGTPPGIYLHNFLEMKILLSCSGASEVSGAYRDPGQRPDRPSPFLLRALVSGVARAESLVYISVLGNERCIRTCPRPRDVPKHARGCTLAVLNEAEEYSGSPLACIQHATVPLGFWRLFQVDCVFRSVTTMGWIYSWTGRLQKGLHNFLQLWGTPQL